MQQNYLAPTVKLSTEPVSKCGAEIIFIPIFEDDDAVLVKSFETSIVSELSSARASGEFKCKNFESLVISIDKPKWKVKRVGFLGAGKKKLLSADLWRRLVSTAVIISRKSCYKKIAFFVPSFREVAGDRVVQALVEGAYLGNFNSGSYKTNKTDLDWVESIELVISGDLEGLNACVERGCVFGEYTNIARSLVNEPSNRLTPRTLASRAKEIGLDAGLEVDVLDEDQIRDLDMGLVMGVAQGSSEPPRVIVMKHDPPGIQEGPVLGFVGKG